MKKTLILLAAIFMALPIFGQQLKFSNMIGDNMVLQQSTTTRIWGSSAPNAQVKATVSWTSSSFSSTADNEGHWIIEITTPAAGFTPQIITIESGSEIISAKNILIGEVWLCSGQSNMAMTLQGGNGTPVEGSLDDIAMAGKYKGVRYINIRNESDVNPRFDCQGSWVEVNPGTAGACTAVGYFFATKLNEALDVPVGIINASWGGAVIDAWMSRELLQNYPDSKLETAGDKSVNAMYQPMIMYNAMFKPASKFAMNGFIWFQGESNVTISRDSYADRLCKMAELWRKDVGRGDVPFLIIEVTPYDYYDGNYGFQDETGPMLREQQHLASTLIPNAGYICTNDLAYDYELSNIHQAQKRPIGERCFYLAMKLGYGYNNLQAVSPSFASATVDGANITVRFNDARAGFIDYGEFEGFEIQSSGGTWHKAKAILTRGGVVLSAKEVHEPIAIRYCYHDFMIGNLKSNAGLPVVPFQHILQ